MADPSQTPFLLTYRHMQVSVVNGKPIFEKIIYQSCSKDSTTNDKIIFITSEGKM